MVARTRPWTRPCMRCKRLFKSTSGGRGYCSDECSTYAMKHFRDYKEDHMTAAEVSAYLDEALRRETAMPWERQ